jgi:hypothetical protein
VRVCAGHRGKGLVISAGLVALLGLAGCVADAARDGIEQASLGSPVRPADPLAEFAGRGMPGAQESVVLAGGGAVPARITREYAAASGRECREVMVGAAATARPQVYCRSDSGGWVAARPLLRGGALR